MDINDPFGFDARENRLGLYFYTAGERYRVHVSCDYTEQLNDADLFYRTFFLAIGAWCGQSWHGKAVEMREAIEQGNQVSLGACRLKELLDDCLADIEPYFEEVEMRNVDYNFLPDPELN